MTRSTLTLHEIDTGTEQVVLETEALIEAPNWSPCGTYLLLNGNGSLYRFELSQKELRRIDTGPLTFLNNDHGISPDGQTFAISNSPGPGLSEMYCIPVAGGAPVKIAQEVPAYWHSWSPDGATLAYTARREGRFHICTCPAAGGAETRLTHGPGFRDGPDYTPDGQWIWFNSDHHGHTPDLWRMHPDGGGLQRMTDDERVNWFPHPSPDGRHVLYLSYGPHVQGHPRDEDVELRVLPPSGGTPRTVAAIHGGQGTINVPCWSPDGKRFAYMRYARARPPGPASAG